MKAVPIASNRAWTFVPGVLYQGERNLDSLVGNLAETAFVSEHPLAAISFRPEEVVLEESSSDSRVLRIEPDESEELVKICPEIHSGQEVVAVFAASDSGLTYRGQQRIRLVSPVRIRLDAVADEAAEEFPRYLPSVSEVNDERVPFVIDPEAIDSARRLHQEMCRALALAAERLGAASVRPNRVALDIGLQGTRLDESFFSVVEVKTFVPENVVQQARLAVGQVLHYRQIMLDSVQVGKLGKLSAHVVLVGSGQPMLGSLRSVFSQVGIYLHVADSIDDAERVVRDILAASI